MPELSMSLSKNFVLREFLRSSTAERDDGLKQEQENPPHNLIDNLRHLVEAALQPDRAVAERGRKVVVKSVRSLARTIVLATSGLLSIAGGASTAERPPTLSVDQWCADIDFLVARTKAMVTLTTSQFFSRAICSITRSADFSAFT